MYDTLEEYNEAITDTRSAIKRALLTGEKNSNNSGGSSRSVEDDIDKLRNWLSILTKERDSLSGTGGSFRLRVGY